MHLSYKAKNDILMYSSTVDNAGTDFGILLV